MPEYEVCDTGGCSSEALFIVEEVLGGVRITRKVCARHYRPST